LLDSLLKRILSTEGAVQYSEHRVQYIVEFPDVASQASLTL